MAGPHAQLPVTLIADRARAMRDLGGMERQFLIDGARNVIDGRARFGRRLYPIGGRT